MKTAAYRELLLDHYRKSWSKPTDRSRWGAGPSHELPGDFEVLVFSRSSEMSAHATLCMSQPSDKERIELHLLTRKTETAIPGLVELLTVIAHYHRSGHALGLGHTVNFGRAWLAGSRCTHGLISLPYLDGPELEWLQEPRVRFLWLIPVTPEEVQFKKRRGVEALEQRFEEAGFDFIDPRRPPVV